MCLCPTCFYGTRCQFTIKWFSLSLGTILGEGEGKCKLMKSTGVKINYKICLSCISLIKIETLVRMPCRGNALWLVSLEVDRIAFLFFRTGMPIAVIDWPLHRRLFPLGYKEKWMERVFWSDCAKVDHVDDGSSFSRREQEGYSRDEILFSDRWSRGEWKKRRRQIFGGTSGNFSPSTENWNIQSVSIVRLVVPRFDRSNRAELSDFRLCVAVLRSSNVRLEIGICQ